MLNRECLSLMNNPRSSSPSRSRKQLLSFTLSEWYTVNDGVMGGRSLGKCEITHDQHLRFHGSISLENRGGFASVRCSPRKFGLLPQDTLVLTVCCDGREYSVNLYLLNAPTAYSYRAPLPTQPGVWTSVRIGLSRFQATSFGRVVPEFGPVPVEQIQAIGIMLADKQPGPFELEVASIEVETSPAV